MKAHWIVLHIMRPVMVNDHCYNNAHNNTKTDKRYNMLKKLVPIIAHDSLLFKVFSSSH